MKQDFKYIIIGNSAAGIGAIEGIRDSDSEGSIAVFSDEKYQVYSRPMITDYLCDETVLAGKMFYREKDFYKENKVELFLDSAVKKIDFGAKKISYEKGEAGFEKLLIATGGAPIVPEIAGLKTKAGKTKEGVFTFTTIADAINLKAYLKGRQFQSRKSNAKASSTKIKTAVILGGGLIGLKTAHALQECGVKVKVVELAECCLAPVLDRASSKIVQALYEKHGIEFFTGRTVKKVEGEKKVSAVILDDKKKIACDIFMVAIGVCPRIELVCGSGIKLNRGIVTDKNQKTSLDFVYAAGDCAESYDFVQEKSRLLPLWPNAYYAGRIAGSNMAGKNASYEWATNMNSFEAYGLSAVSAGIINPPCGEYEILKYEKPAFCSRVIYKAVKHVSYTGDLVSLQRSLYAGRNNATPEGREDCGRDDRRITSNAITGDTGEIYKKLILEKGIIRGMIFINDIESAGVILSLMRKKIDVTEFKDKLLKPDFSFAAFPEKLRDKLYERPE